MATEAEKAALQEKLEKYQKELEELIKKLQSHEDDYLILLNAEDELAKANAILDYHSHLEKSLQVSIDNIVDLGTTDKVPGFEELFTKFDDSMSNELSSLTEANNNCMTEMKNSGQKIDAAKEELSTKIEAIKNAIQNYTTMIANIQVALSQP